MVYLVVLFEVHCLFMPVSQVIHFDTITLGVDVATVGDRLTCRRPHLYVSERERESEEWAREEGESRLGGREAATRAIRRKQTRSQSIIARGWLKTAPQLPILTHICGRRDYT